ncbi:hypothetical protein H6G33_13405 [Calothrix sp. FACHB-1219]|uniref:hypothetical protein n=1 Tax=unclassified Calothrix TaxID=2619626 RepID=UPI001687B3CF|nr:MULTISPECIES: hypothetical protein [unclassified Calothrix]MBD2204820.1 hypothetical protein [Calothrix sp. FACHB-168]MBD2218032.1 hypothetical protein [Calothrix sp. FACHB-1219]
MTQNISANLNNNLNLNKNNISRISLRSEKRDSENSIGENTRAAFNTEPSIILLPCLLLLMGWIVIIHKRYLVAEAKQIKELENSPCKDCRFFVNNKYLNCAVNPSIVLTKAAIDCRDYDALGNRKKVNLCKESK